MFSHLLERVIRRTTTRPTAPRRPRSASQTAIFAWSVGNVEARKICREPSGLTSPMDAFAERMLHD